MVTPILPVSLSDVVVKRRGKTLLGPLDLTVPSGGCTIVMGPNGSGKTTFLRTLHGLERLNQGAITWSVPVEAARSRQTFVFQTPIMMRRSVRDNLAFPLLVSGASRAEALRSAQDWADRIGLENALERYAPRLSGGEKQKLALARALISTPDVVFLDEPCANLDGQSTREIEMILKEAQASGTRILMSTHDVGQAKRLADDVLFFMHGEIIESGNAAAFFAAPKTPQASALLRGDIVE